ncbi:hypothetical protein FRX31_024485 [Thalictrum thalictroides]|uniref:Uncharacterized protein n=1 Tax=Thalictrum thalictroides TaxID=46969 RepID=A0A7J6VMS3_THATH|nr:hypothetical protein FRX31_024485 [Thalictrum thalictroides]
MKTDRSSNHAVGFGDNDDSDFEPDYVQDIEDDMAQRYGVEPLEMIVQARLERMKKKLMDSPGYANPKAGLGSSGVLLGQNDSVVGSHDRVGDPLESNPKGTMAATSKGSPDSEVNTPISKFQASGSHDHGSNTEHPEKRSQINDKESWGDCEDEEGTHNTAMNKQASEDSLPSTCPGIGN